MTARTAPDDEFDHRLDARFARLRDATMRFRPDLAGEFDACLPVSLRVAGARAGRRDREAPPAGRNTATATERKG